MFVPGLEEVDR